MSELWGRDSVSILALRLPSPLALLSCLSLPYRTSWPAPCLSPTAAAAACPLTGMDAWLSRRYLGEVALGIWRCEEERVGYGSWEEGAVGWRQRAPIRC